MVTPTIENGLLASVPPADLAALRPHVSPVTFDLKQVLHQAERPDRRGLLPGVRGAVDGRRDDRRALPVKSAWSAATGWPGWRPGWGWATSPAPGVLPGAWGQALKLPVAAVHDEVHAQGRPAGRGRVPVHRRAAVPGVAIDRVQPPPPGRRPVRPVAADDARPGPGRTSSPITQEFLSIMLGVQRPTVSIAAGAAAAGRPDPVHPRPDDGPRTGRAWNRPPASATQAVRDYLDKAGV